MARLSVNVNKIATLRNSRGKNQPDLIETVKKLISFGVHGITLHPRPDGRHILYNDVRQISQLLNQTNFVQSAPSKVFASLKEGMKTDTSNQVHLNQRGFAPSIVEFNVEGYPSPHFLKLMEEVKPHQCTLVPDPPSVLTSNAGWDIQNNFELLNRVLLVLKKHKIRTALFLDPKTLDQNMLKCLAILKPDRAELYTSAYVEAYNTVKREEVTSLYVRSACALLKIGIEVNAGHDLNLQNLGWLLKNIPQIKEVSIGHALICSALYQGLEKVTKQYLKICTKVQGRQNQDHQKGACSEDLALAFFQQQGWCLHSRNQKIVGVELDLIMKKKEAWLLVEVKSDNTWRRDRPMSQHQQKRLHKAFSAFCESHSSPVQILLAIVDKQKKVHTFDLEF